MRLRRFACSCLLGGLLALQGSWVAAQRCRIAEARKLPATGHGWHVEPATRSLIGVFPVGTLPGDIPIPLSVRLNGTYVYETYQVNVPDEVTRKLGWQPNITLIPAYGAVHFGYIAPQAQMGPWTPTGYAVRPASYVLEDGTTYTDSDFAAGNSLSLLNQFGLAGNPSQAVYTSNDLAVAKYQASAADLGSLAGQVQSVNPAGFGGAAPTQWTVMVTAQRARVYAFLPAPLNVWAPVLFADKSGHTVTFQWKKGTSGADTVYSVMVMNPQLNKGLQVQWLGTYHDGDTMLRADFINVDAPSLWVEGQGCGTPSCLNLANYVEPVTLDPVLPGVSFLPTKITVGSNLPSGPVWTGGGLPIPNPVSADDGHPRVWTLTYTDNSSALSSIQEPNGLLTTFANEFWSNPLPFSTTVGGNYRQDAQYFYGVGTAVSTDSVHQLARTQSWVWDTSVSTEPMALIHQDYYGSSADRETRWVFATYGQAAGNGALSYEVVRDPVSRAVTKRVDYSIIQVGVDGSYTPPQTITTSYPDGSAPKTVLTRNFNTAAYGLQMTSETLTAGTGNTNVQRTDKYFAYLPGYLEPARLMSTTVTAYGPSGGPLTPSRTTVLEYDNGQGNGKGFVTKQYLDGDALGQIGQSIAYNGDGRPNTVAAFNSRSTTPIWSKAYTYDPATGGVAQIQTTYATLLGGPGTSTLTWTANAWDTLGRPTSFTDEKGVVTTQSYDIRGRLGVRQVAGLAATSMTYPDETTVTTTQGGLASTVVRDLFHRVVKRTAPDRTYTDLTYDGDGRLHSQQLYSKNGNPQPAKIWSYDAINRVTSTTNVERPGVVTSTLYSVNATNASLAQTLTKKGLDSNGQPITFTGNVNAVGQVITSQDALGTTTTITYDGMGNQVEVDQMDASGNIQTRKFGYDALGRLVSRTEPETASTTFQAFDALNHPTTIIEANTRTRTLQWDGLGRLQSMTGVVGENTAAETYTYNGSFLTDASNTVNGSAVTQHFDYYPAAQGAQLQDEVTTQPGLVSTIGYRYNASNLGEVNTITYPSGNVVTYGYDDLVRPVSVTSTLGGVSQTIVPMLDASPFDEWGNRASLTFQSGAKDEWTMDTSGRLSGLSVTPKGGIPLGWSYQYDQTTGGLTSTGEWSIKQDSLHRLTWANQNWVLAQDGSGNTIENGAGLMTDSFSQDAYGNNGSSTTTSTGMVPEAMNNFTFSNPQVDNRIPSSAVNGASVGTVYDPYGELSQVLAGVGSKASMGMTWDALGRLSSVTDGQTGDRSSYLYAPSGTRVSTVSSLDASQNRFFGYTSSGLLTSEFETPAEAVAQATPVDLWTNGGTAVITAAANGWNGQYISVPCAPGDTFYAQAFARFTASTPGNTHIWMRFDSDTQTAIGWAQALSDGTPWLTSSTTRTRLGAMGIAPIGCTKVLLYIESGGCNPGDIASFDSIAFSKGMPVTPGNGLVPLDLWTNGSSAVLTASANGWMGQYISVPCAPGDVYYARAYARFTAATPGNTHIWMRFDSDTTTGIGWGQALSDGTPWLTNSTTRTLLGAMGVAPVGTTKVLLYIESGWCNPGDIASFDSIEFSKGAPIESGGGSVPLDLWTNGNSAVITAAANGWSGQYITVPCTPGDVYYAQAFARFTAATPGNTHIWMRFDSDTQTGLGWGQALPDGTPWFTSSTTRTQLGAMGVAPAGTTKVLLYIESGWCNPGDIASFDSVSFSKGARISSSGGSVPLDLWTNGSNSVLTAATNGWSGQYITLPCAPGDVYYAQAYARFSAQTPGNAHTWMRFDSDTQTGIGWGQALPDGTPWYTNSTTRTRIGAMGIAPAGTTKVLLYIESGWCNPGDIASFDSIAFTKGTSTATNVAKWKRDVIYLGSQAIAEIDTNGVHELHCDHLGTPRIITNGESGAVEGTQTYGPYGEMIGGWGYVPLTGYTGHMQTEPNGLIYMHGRFYSPAWHCFLNSDQGTDPNQMNQYAYCGGNPMERVDPFGMKSKPSDGSSQKDDESDDPGPDLGGGGVGGADENPGGDDVWQPPYGYDPTGYQFLG